MTQMYCDGDAGLHPIERVGRELRRKMAFVEPRERVPGQGGA
jgi:ketol-acid reductoisomerase